MTPDKQCCTSAQAISKSASKKGLSEGTISVAAKLQKADIKRSLGQYHTPPSSPIGTNPEFNKSENNEPTPSTTPDWGNRELSWDSNAAEAVLWDTHSRPGQTDETSLWNTGYAAAQNDDLTPQIFKKIYYACVKLPHLTTESRRSRNKTFQPFAEVAEAAFRFAHKHGVNYHSEVRQPTVAEKSILVQAAEGYKKVLMASKVSNVLNKAEHAHLDVIIASQHWEASLPVTEETLTISTSQAQKTIANPPEYLNSTQQSSTKTWGQSEYLAWAKRNLTDATAIKLARTYCDHLGNGTAPMHVFSTMGKQAPPGTSFEYFSLLPYELREQIWLLVLEKEKNDVRIIWNHKEKDGHYVNTSFINANNQQRLLFVNRELRGLAIKRNYELAFGTRHSRAQTYFDFKRDRLFIHTRHCTELPKLVKYIRTKDAERVQNLAIPLRDLLGGNEHKIAEALCKFKNAKRIHLVCGDGIEDVRFCRAGDPQLAKNIQRFLYKTWRKHNDPNSWPRVRMYTIPAIVAHDFAIDHSIY
jgi:hypothetical protein